MPKKRQSSGIPHISEPFVAAEEYAYRREKAPRLSGDVRREGKDGLSGLLRPREPDRPEKPNRQERRAGLVYLWEEKGVRVHFQPACADLQAGNRLSPLFVPFNGPSKLAPFLSGTGAD
jgi:hypothetical protein